MDSPPTPRRIDSHHHFWNPATRDYPWMPAELKHPYGPESLQPLLDAAGIDGTVLVQTVGEVQETREFLAIADATPAIEGVVGWVDLTDPQTPQTLQDLINGPHGTYLVGIRHQVHDENDPGWLLQEVVQSNLEAIAAAGLVYDLLVRPAQLPAAITVARDFPHMKFVVDHIAKPPIASGEIEPWSALMHEFAGLQHVACKLSGMVTETNPDGWTADDLVPYVGEVFNIFGPDRLMFGSDWPVCTLAASYQEVVDSTRAALTTLDVLTPENDAAIFGNTATTWYGLNRNQP